MNRYYAVKNKDDIIRKESASGGFFTVIAEFVLNNGGYVYGASLCEDGKVQHIKIDNIENLYLLRGSKYVQSEMGKTLKLVKEDINNGYLVLFTGTPCQCAAVKAVLGDNDNIILADIICHGVSSPKAFQKYWKMLESEHGKIKAYKFRDKEFPWNQQRWSVEYSNKKKDTTSYELRSYKEMYYKTILHRESCYKCPFATVDRVTDFTMGDFWKIEEVDRTFYDDKGVSLVIIHTLKGMEVWDKVSSNILYIQVQKEDCFQPQLYMPTKELFPKSKFWKDFLENNEYKKVMKKYGWPKFSRRLKDLIKKYIKKVTIYKA